MVEVVRISKGVYVKSSAACMKGGDVNILKSACMILNLQTILASKCGGRVPLWKSEQQIPSLLSVRCFFCGVQVP